MTEPAWSRLLRAWNRIEAEAGRADESKGGPRAEVPAASREANSAERPIS